MLVRLVGVIRMVVLVMFAIRLVAVLVGVSMVVRMAVLDLSMPVLMVMGMRVFVFVLHVVPSLHLTHTSVSEV